MRIRRVTQADAGRWDEYVSSRNDASFYHRYDWRGFFEDYFGKQTEYLAAFDAHENITGVLPLVRLQSKLFGNFFVSLPFVNYGGVIADEHVVLESLISEAAQIANEFRVSHIELRHAGVDCELPSRTDKVAMYLDLPNSPEALGKSIGSKRRSQIRRPQRENPSVLIGREELVDDFYSVFSRNMRDLGTPVYAKSMFADLLQRFPKNTNIMLIRVHDTAAAAAFLIDGNGTMEVPWASTRRDFNRISINMLLYWEILGHAIETGAKIFDFGRSTVDSGTYRFKKQWGARPVQMKWHYWLAEQGNLPRLNPENPKYRMAIAMWQKLPLPIANLFGPHIVRHLP